MKINKKGDKIILNADDIMQSSVEEIDIKSLHDDRNPKLSKLNGSHGKQIKIRAGI